MHLITERWLVLNYQYKINIIYKFNFFLVYLIDLKLGESKNAITDCNNCLKIDPENIKALLRKAQCHLQLDDKQNVYYKF